ncbi:enterochelin esterase family protein [Kribbella aluminosa]|uniref:Enterochelin esterase family protein n=1 Tax=Kribbella aluminosa TaxID=416017 RepID=A0ABS4UUB5_9ACTN|nr:enterochelin esterase [Kribbella aluminosa]MBP2355149.1 enterochelin esterase family protein [Kribbella aluminosa]
MTERMGSPRLRELDPARTDEFWAEVAERGTPLVEPAGDDDVWLTFLYRAGEPVSDVSVSDVSVFGGPAGWDPPGNVMHHLAGTDVWYLTFRVRADLRCTYRLAVDDVGSTAAAAEDWSERTAHWFADPLNPATFVYPEDEATDSHETVVSLASLPSAPSQPWITPRAGAAGGELAQYSHRSELLGNERRIWVYTPQGYTPDVEPLPLLVLFDGDTVRGPMPMPAILDNLIGDGQIPPMIAVLVDSLTQEVRNRELPCGAPFLEYLTDELLPWVRERYRITTDPARTIVAGQSHGGQAAAFAALRRPNVFGNVISQSGSFWWRPDGEDEHEWLTRQYAESARQPVRFYLEAGLQERGQTPDAGPSILVANRHLRTILLSKGYEVQYSEFNGGHDYACWRGSIAAALIALT